MVLTQGIDDLLALARRAGCRLSAEGDRIKVKGHIPDELRGRIISHKPALLERLAHPCPECGGPLEQGSQPKPWRCWQCGVGWCIECAAKTAGPLWYRCAACALKVGQA